MENDTTTLTLRLEADLVRDAQRLYEALGLDLTTAINVFFRQSIRAGGFPFAWEDERQPNAKTLAALREAERLASDATVTRYADVEAALKALKA